MIGRNDPCFCGSGKKYKACHFPAVPPQDALREKYFKQHRIRLKTPEQIEGIRRSCQLAAYILDEIAKKAVAGVTTNELNDFANKLHKEANAIPAPLHYGYPPFPKSICTSINDVVCHGIPDDRPLEEGDIMNIDVSCILDSYYGDCSKMVMIGKVSSEKRRLCESAYECLMRSIKILKPGIPLYQIGEVIEDYASRQGFSVVYQFVGHGVGIEFHEAPQVPHCRNTMNILLAPGMTFTIEPMINEGVREVVVDSTDGWTARTKDGKSSAQWEHTVLITDEGCEILTLRQ